MSKLLSAITITRLHSVYVDLTGLKIGLGFDRERSWYEFIKAGFTEDDLRMVIGEIKRGIKAGKRNPGALRFHNLIENLDYFEEELAMARVRKRTPEQNPAAQAISELRRCHPEPFDPHVPAVPVKVPLERVISEMRKAAQ